MAVIHFNESIPDLIVKVHKPQGLRRVLEGHLAWALARRWLDQAGPETELFGWDDDRRLLPVILPLRRLAGALGAANAGAQTVYEALCGIVASYGVKAPDDLLTDALVRGAAIVLFDGLDEVPVEATATSARRRRWKRA